MIPTHGVTRSLSALVCRIRKRSAGPGPRRDARYCRSVGVVNEERLKQSALTSTFEKDFEGRVKGLGPAVYRWLVMRQGVDTVKPNVHVRRFAEAAVVARSAVPPARSIVSTLVMSMAPTSRCTG